MYQYNPLLKIEFATMVQKQFRKEPGQIMKQVKNYNKAKRFIISNKTYRKLNKGVPMPNHITNNKVDAYAKDGLYVLDKGWMKF